MGRQASLHLYHSPPGLRCSSSSSLWRCRRWSVGRGRGCRGERRIVLCSTKQNSTCSLKKIYYGSHWVRLILRSLCFVRTNSFHLEFPKKRKRNWLIVAASWNVLNWNSSLVLILFFRFLFLENKLFLHRTSTCFDLNCHWHFFISHSGLLLCISAKPMQCQGSRSGQLRSCSCSHQVWPNVSRVSSVGLKVRACVRACASQHLLFLKSHQQSQIINSRLVTLGGFTWFNLSNPNLFRGDLWARKLCIFVYFFYFVCIHFPWDYSQVQIGSAPTLPQMFSLSYLTLNHLEPMKTVD